MKLISKIWACEKNFLQGYLDAHSKLNASNVSKEEIKSFINNGEKIKLPSILEINGQEASISIMGPLSKSGPDFCDVLMGFGGASYLEIIESTELLLLDDDIKKVTLKMDTPGGTVNGVDETYQAIVALAEKKHVVAENHGMIASAGYWLASAAKEIVSVAPTTLTGSIGVIISTYDDSEYLKQIGYKKIVIVSKNAPNKNADVSTKKGIQLLTDLANDTEEVFIKRVASGRNVSEETVKSDFGKGGILITKEALKVGLIDEQIGLDLENNNPDKDVDLQDTESLESNTEQLADPAAVAGEQQTKGGRMTLKELLAKDPAMAKELDEVKSEAQAAGAKAKQEEINKSVDGAAKFLIDSYPKSISDLAVSVIKGEKTLDSLEAAVSAFDGAKEAIKSDAAQAETDDQGETKPEQEELEAKTGQLKTEKDEQAAIEKLKNNF